MRASTLKLPGCLFSNDSPAFSQLEKQRKIISGVSRKIPADLERIKRSVKDGQISHITGMQELHEQRMIQATGQQVNMLTFMHYLSISITIYITTIQKSIP